jgi:putative phosphonate metabolism protein
VRYAVYFTPPQDDPLTRAAVAWLGRDAFAGPLMTPPADAGMALSEWEVLTADPRRYGFHATLKAPFTLADGVSLPALEAGFDRFCQTTAPVVIPRLTLAQLGPFFALVPDGDSQGVDGLCAAVVEAFEPFRAALSPDDVARRKPERLTERQRAYLDTWGYPYVFDEFRFHMTLTGPVAADDQPRIRELLTERFSAFINRPLPVAHLGLSVELQRGAPFMIAQHAALRGAAETGETIA